MKLNTLRAIACTAFVAGAVTLIIFGHPVFGFLFGFAAILVLT